MSADLRAAASAADASATACWYCATFAPVSDETASSSVIWSITCCGESLIRMAASGFCRAPM